MEPLTIGVLGLAAVILMIALGMRIAFAAAFVGIIGLIVLRGLNPALTSAGFIPFGAVTNYGFSVIPLFILMGYFGFYGGLSDEMFDTLRKWVGHLPGGLAIATVFGCAAFAATSGASTASCAIMGKIATPEMIKYGYGKKLSAAVVAASGTLASLIPPSIVIVIYGIITEESVGTLLVAGFIPGIVSAIIYALMIVVWVKLFPQGGGFTAPSWRERFVSLKGLWGPVLVLGIIVGGIYTGVFTPTEAGAIGAFVCFVIALLRKGLTLAKFKAALLEAAKTSIMLFAIIIGVTFFIRFLATSGAPAAFAEGVLHWNVHRVIVMMGILSLFVVLGMFMNAASMMMLTVPVVLPAVVALGYDPIWFGIVVVKMCEVCLITAPVGLNLYVTHSVVKDITFEELSLGVLPFLAMDFLTVALFFVFPQIITFLPATMAAMN